MKTRFIRSVVQSAQTAQVEMPWARGRRRAAMIARRKATLALRRTA